MREKLPTIKGIANIANSVMNEGANNTYVAPVQPREESKTGTVLGEGIVFEGATIKGKGPVHILGNFSGAINVDGHVVLGETGVLSGEVRATSALLSGKYEGTIFVKNVLEIASNANLVGRITSGKIIIEEGAIIKGDCNIGNSERQQNVTKAEKELQQQIAQHAK